MKIRLYKQNGECIDYIVNIDELLCEIIKNNKEDNLIFNGCYVGIYDTPRQLNMHLRRINYIDVVTKN